MKPGLQKQAGEGGYPAGHWHRFFMSRGGDGGAFELALTRRDEQQLTEDEVAPVAAIGASDGSTAPRSLRDLVSDAGVGRCEWPPELVWRQTNRRKTWPCFMVANSRGMTFVDDQGEDLLSEIVPEGGWDTVEAAILGPDGEPRLGYRLLRTPRLIRRAVVIEPRLGDDVATIPEDTEAAPGIGRLASRDGTWGEVLCIAPDVAVALERARVRRGSRLGGLQIEPVPWTSEVSGVRVDP